MSSSSPSSPAADQALSESKPGMPSTQQPLAPGLYVVATPIGNLRDITLRALDVLASVDEVLAEDTRMAQRLLTAHGLSAKVTPYHDHNGAARRPELVERLKAGAKLALISDAGTPLVSDPGYKLVQEITTAGIPVIPVPGASALLAGLVAAGLPSDRFLFAGFPPVKSAARRNAFNELADLKATVIFYEAARRLPATLHDMAESFGADRPAAIARELTKRFEETRRGTLSALATHYAEAGAPKGEVVVLIGPSQVHAGPSQEHIDTALRTEMAKNPLKIAAGEVATRFGLSKRDVYQRALTLKHAAQN